MQRVAFLGLAGLLALVAVGCGPQSNQGSEASVMTAERQKSMTPQDVLADLKAGNERFVANRGLDYDWLAQAKATESGQFPKAIVLGCVDSRVPVEVVFDQGIGDIFVARVAGNFENVDLLGSMEFGTQVAGSKVIVVLGHTHCGAVKGAIDGVEMGNLTSLLKNIAVDEKQPGQTSADKDLVQRVTERTVLQTVSDIRERSAVMAKLISENKLLVVGGIYDIASGRVRWLDS
jgi:carbonic anhydrase